MAEVEPIKLDMGGLMQMGLGLQQTQLMRDRLNLEQEQTRLQEQRLNVDLSKAQSEVQLKYMTEQLKDPNTPIFQKFSIVNRMSDLSGIGKIDPTEYTKAENLFNGLVTSAATLGPTAPETQSFLSELMQSPIAPMFRQHAQEQMKQASEKAKVQGAQRFMTRAFGSASPQEAQLGAESPQIQSKAAESLTPMEQARTKEVQAKTAALELQGQQLSQTQKHILSYANPVFDLNAEEAYFGKFATEKKLGTVAKDLLGSEAFDTVAQSLGTLTSDERNSMKTQINGDISSMGDKRRALQQELRAARYSTGEVPVRDVSQIQSELQAVQMGMQVKQAEQAYLNNPSKESFEQLQAIYQHLDQTLLTNKQQIQNIRQAQLGVAQGSLNEKILEHQQTQAYKQKLIPAQAEFAKSDRSNSTAGLIAEKHGVLATDILKAGETPNQPPVQINMGKGLGEKVSDIVMESRNMALGASDTVDAVQRARAAISKDLVNVGPTATIRQKIGQVSQVLGIGGKDNEERLVNTRNVIRSLAQFSLGARKQLKGQGQVSDFEGKLIIKAESGEIEDMTIPELKSFLNVTERLARKGYALHQQNLGRMKQNPELREAVPFYEVPELPAEKAGAAPSAPSSGPKVGTIEEGYRFKGGNPADQKNWEKVK